MGSAEILHPFHPRKGQRFAVLKVRRVAGIDTLILRDADLGSFAVPQDWTDQARAAAWMRLSSPTKLDIGSLCDLVELLERMSARCTGGLAK